MKRQNPYIIKKSNRKNKKYVAIFDDKKVHFGHSSYQQYKDSTGLGVYSHLDHGDMKRRKLYYARHGKHANLYSAKYFSHKYLW